MIYQGLKKLMLKTGAALLVSVFCFGLIAQADVREDYPYMEWYIDNFEVDLKPRTDGVLDVTEYILADFSETSKRGIIREIPYKYDVPGKIFDRKIGIDVLSVKDDDGNEWEYKVYKNGNYVNVRIGNASVYWSEPLFYEIKYEVDGILNNFDKSESTDELLGDLPYEKWDEIYWNAIGTEWRESPIERYRVQVDFTDFGKDEVLRYGCFIGSYGSEDRCKTTGGMDGFQTSGFDLGYLKGITVGMAFEDGVIKERFSLSKLLLQWEYLIWIYPLLVVVFFVRHWYLKGRDLPRKSIIARYELDDEMRAMEVGTLVDERFTNEDLVAGIIDLSVRGFIRVEELEKKGWFGGAKLKFVKLKDYKNAGLLDFEKRLMKGLFGSKNSVELDDLAGSFYITVGSVKGKIFDYLVDQGFYKKNPMTIRSNYLGAGAFILFGGAWLSMMIMQPWLLFFIVPIGLSAMAVAPFMSKKTEKGMRAYEQVLGFKEFIKVAEKDRVKFFQEFNDVQSKEDKVRVFEKLLPFAMAYGMGEQWAGIFDELFKGGYQPGWYRASDGGFDSLRFNRSLKSLDRGMRSAGVPPSSSGSSGGSFSGGFSGGGFGGGGGSSW